MNATKSADTRETRSLSADFSEREKAGADKKSARKVHGSFPKADVRHWQSRVRREGSADYGIQIKLRGKRHRFALKTPNKDAAARKACDIYKCIVAKGWEATIAEHKPETVKAPKGASVGDLILAASELSRCRPATLQENVSAFRRIVADVEGIEKDAARFARCGNGRALWLAALAAVPLAKLTADRLEAWMQTFVSANSKDELHRRAAHNTANATLRKARSLFSKRLVRLYAQRLELPAPLPFDGVTPFPRQSMRYVSTIDLKALVAAAVDELATADAEALKAFLLCLCGGLRRNEADKLRWSSVDFDAGVIRIETQSDFTGKNEDSLGDVPLESAVRDILRGLRAKQPKAEYVLDGVPLKRANATWREYRADATFARLNVWLRAKGVTDAKPLHTLRKEAGSLVCKSGGLLAASRFLRHADIAITAQHYVDQRPVVTVGFASLLAPADNVIAPDFTASPPLAGEGERMNAKA